MKTLILIATVFFINSLCCFSQAKINTATNEKFAKEWRKIDSLDKKGLPKSGLEIVEKIYEKAKKDNNYEQFIKTFIYKLKYTNTYEEGAFETKLLEFEKEIKTASFPTKSIMSSVAAEMYWIYYQRNRWKFYGRTSTVNFDSEDIKTWDLNRLADRCIKHYMNSLEKADSLKQIAIDAIEDLLTKGSVTVNIRPTLYDFLAHRAIDFFSNAELSLTQPADKFEMRDKDYFADAEQFGVKKIETGDTLSLRFYAVKALQALLRLRLADSNKEAFIDADLKRLDFVNRFAVIEQKDSLYFEMLKKLESKYKDIPYSSEIFFKIAAFHSRQASKFNPLIEETIKYKWENKTALEICDKVIAAYPNTSGASKCTNLKCEILRPAVSFQTEKNIEPDQKFAVKISYKNAPKLYIRYAQIDPLKIRKITERYYGKELIGKLKKESAIKQFKIIELPDDKDFQTHSSEILADKLPIGSYVVLISNDEKFSYEDKIVAYDFITVTNLTYVQRRKTDGNYDFYVFHRKTGEPLANVSAQVWYYDYNYKIQKYLFNMGPSFTSDQNGYFKVPCRKKDYRTFYVSFTKDKDFLSSDDSYYYDYYYTPPKKHNSIFFFTDRAIYRPGQTIYFKGITLETDGKNNAIVPNFSCTVTFYDVNYQKINDLKVTTNEFGTFNGTFEIPTNLLNGVMQITTPYGSKAVSVEEYKRPKFLVEMLPNNGIYKINEEVEVKGTAKAYSGANLTDVKVAYRVVRTPQWRGWWFCWYRFTDMEIANGAVTTNEKGEFSVKFNALPDLSVAKDNNIVFNYKIHVDVTDINGETQSAQGNIIVGYVALSVGLDMNPEMCKEAIDTIKILTQNLNSEFIPAKGNLKIFKISDPQNVLKDRLWERPDKYLFSEQEWYAEYPGNVYKEENEERKMKKGEQVFDRDFDTEKNKKLFLKEISGWKNGRYVAVITSKDKFGNDVSNEKYFTVFSKEQKEVPYVTADWFSSLKIECQPGDIAKFIVGSSLQNVKVLYEIEQFESVIEKKYITLNNEQKLIEIPIIESHRGNIVLHLTFIKNGRLYTHTAPIYVPRSDKELTLEFETFRDKLQPGQQEEWRVKILNDKKDKVAAEMLAALYDASLDVFKMNYWDFNIYPMCYPTLYLYSTAFTPSYSQFYTENPNSYCYAPGYVYDKLNWFGFYYDYNYGYYYHDSYKYRRSKGEPMAGAFREELAEYDAAIVTELPVACDAVSALGQSVSFGRGDGNAGGEKKEEESDVLSIVTKSVNGKPKERQFEELSNVKARANFAETAFFYPDLRTNEKGEVIIKFTIPESLTKWKMMGFSHTKDLKYGFIKKDLVTQKELMVIPNPPRFFRENDEIEFPVKISNVTDKEISGFAKIEFFDAITMKPVSNIFAENGGTEPKEFKIAAGQNTSLKWKLKIPEGIGAIDYKVVAKAGRFSDGEENVIPVLTNRMLVTESFPLPIRGKTSKNFEFAKLKNFKSSSTLRNQKLTLEFTSNPAWYAVQALPYIMEYPYECAEQVFSRFYANSLASHIANSKPKIKKVFDSWKNTPDSKALLSNLEKNQELKTLLLEETPWVLNAQDETFRKKQVGLLFDLNKMSRELNSAMKKLLDMQVSNGGWPWFPGMPESRYITQHVVTGMAHLDNLGVTKIKEDKRVWNMVERAVHYLDYEVKKDYEYLKKYYTKEEMELNHLSEIEIHYLYARSYFKDRIDLPSGCKDAFNYYKGQAEKYWLSQSKYMQAMIGFALYNYGTPVIPQDIVKSLRENSSSSEEMGMYWKDVEAGYNWWQAPIETQALMIELFDKVAKDEQAVNDLKVWLLKQKQTQDWRTTKATVEAIYALLLKGAEWLDSDELVKVKLGDIDVDPKKMDGVKVEAGTGYYKTSWAGGEIVPEMGNITVTKNNEGVSWGAIYWQYFEQLDKITPHETPLKLNKKLFIERDSKSGKIIEPLDEKVKLTVGDKVIVRIELRVDRNMEFVHMKDMRASGFEPINVISRYKWQDGLGYYESTKDAATNFFMSYMPKGTYVFEYPLRVTHNGDFSNGITQIQCMYAPEFSSHSEGIRVKVGDK
ncbi:MAG: hypothetical protein HY958_10835 [Bacteroidia bacterium]|nr:hypothetical protein [Bacteroidia bacterium]